MNRRSFLRAFGLGLAATAMAPVVDPDELLWTPGKKTFFLPHPPAQHALRLGDVFTINGRYAVNPSILKATSALEQFVVTDVADATTVRIHPYNQLITPEWVTRETMKMAENNLKLAGHINRQWSEPTWAGTTIALRKSQRFVRG